jgi:signal peptidase II
MDETPAIPVAAALPSSAHEASARTGEAGAGKTPPFPASRFVVYGALVACGLALDLATKAIVFGQLGYPHRSSDWSWGTPLLWGRFDIRLTTSFNQGALFGMGQGFTPVFALLSVAAVGFVVWWLFKKGEARSLWLTIALGLVSAGALGNLHDRLWLHGCRTIEGVPLTGVRDFLDCRIPWVFLTAPEGGFAPRLVEQWPWPIFNLADSFLVCGAALLLVQSLFAPQTLERAVCQPVLAEPRVAGA